MFIYRLRQDILAAVELTFHTASPFSTVKTSVADQGLYVVCFKRGPVAKAASSMHSRTNLWHTLYR